MIIWSLVLKWDGILETTWNYSTMFLPVLLMAQKSCAEIVGNPPCLGFQNTIKVLMKQVLMLSRPSDHLSAQVRKVNSGRRTPVDYILILRWAAAERTAELTSFGLQMNGLLCHVLPICAWRNANGCSWNWDERYSEALHEHDIHAESHVLASVSSQA